MAKGKGKWLESKVVEVPTGTINGVNTVFTLSQIPVSVSDLTLYLDGLYETDYSIDVPNKQITMTTAPALGQYLRAEYRAK